MTIVNSGVMRHAVMALLLCLPVPAYAQTAEHTVMLMMFGLHNDRFGQLVATQVKPNAWTLSGSRTGTIQIEKRDNCRYRVEQKMLTASATYDFDFTSLADYRAAESGLAGQPGNRVQIVVTGKSLVHLRGRIGGGALQEDRSDDHTSDTDTPAAVLMAAAQRFRKEFCAGK